MLNLKAPCNDATRQLQRSKSRQIARTFRTPAQFSIAKPNHIIGTMADLCAQIAPSCLIKI
jgi:hypothetical protein